MLQEGTLSRVGGREQIEVNVRIIAATHRDLSAMVENSLFREDLYYRLNVFALWIPPLRDRPEDIPLLTEFFIRNKCARQGWKPPEVPQSTLRSMCAYSWPGNIRELQNAVERALIIWGGNVRRPFSVGVGQHHTRTEPCPVPQRRSPCRGHCSGMVTAERSDGAQRACVVHRVPEQYRTKILFLRKPL